MNKKQKTKLLRLIKNHVDSQIELTLKGCQSPDVWDIIETNAKEDKREMIMFLQELCTDET